MPEAETYRKLNDIDLVDISLESDQGGKTSILEMCKHVSIYEDIYSPCLTGYAYISDSMALINHFPINGHESFIIKFRTPGIGSSVITLKFEVYSVTDRFKANNERTEMYRINFISKGYRFSEIQRISRSYEGKISNIVKNIIEDYFPEDTKYLIQETKNENKFVIPNLKPMDAIKWLAEMSMSESQPHDTNFVFYESLDHYNFISMGKLSTSSAAREYTMKPTGIRDGKNNILDKFLNVQAFENGKDFNRAEDAYHGLYSSRLWTHDITTKEWGMQAFNYRNSFEEGNHVEEHPILPTLSKHTMSFNGPSYFKPKQTGQFSELLEEETYKPEEWFLKRKSSVGTFGNKIINVKIAGDSRLRAGEVAKITIPSNEPLSAYDHD